MKSILIIVAKIIAAPIASVLMLAGYNVYQPKTIIVTPSPKVVISSPSSSPQITLGNYNPTGGGTYRLKNSIGLSNTSINLSSFKEPISNLPYTMTYLNSTTGYGTLDAQTPTKSEFISFTGITQNSDGSAQLTGVTRGLSRTPGTGGCVASTTLAISHSGQSTFILSNSPCFYSNYAVKSNDEVITGAWTGITPTSPTGFAIKSYVDSVVGGVVTTDKLTPAGTAGETISAGQVVYLKQADQRWYKAAVNIMEASTSPIGIAQGSGTAGVAISGGVMTSGLDITSTGLTAGATYFLGSTAGTLSTATSTRVVGKARTSTSLYVDSTFIPIVTGLNNTFLGGNTFASSTSFLATTTIKGGAPFIATSSVSTTNGTTIDLQGIYTTGEYTRVLVFASTTNISGAASLDITFNSDSSSSYLQGAPNGSTLTKSSIDPFNADTNRFSGGGNEFLILDIHNPNGAPKFINVQGVMRSSQTGIEYSTSTSYMWRNNSTINRITLTSGTGAALSTGYIKVYENSN